ncbi:MAG: glutathione S-transferase N-terminal domain-containing protein [Pseudomonadota bacterium]
MMTDLADNLISRSIDVMSSSLSTALRPGMGIGTRPAAVKPAQTLELYEFESCPFCRLVREALTELDLDAVIYPCPKGGQRFRPTVEELGGRSQFPYLVDPNTGTAMYESLAIVRYLFETYGRRSLPLKWRFTGAQKLGSTLAGIPRPWQGRRASPGRLPNQMIELYSFESSPFARPVRERLCEMEIPYVLRSCGRSSMRDWVPPPVRKALNVPPSAALPNRRDLLERAGQISIPCLYDPNSETLMFESRAIKRYLRETYR